MKRRIQAFTLIELLIVMTIIAIISAIAIPNLLESRKTARQADVISMMRELITAQEIFRARELGGSNRFGTIAELTSTPVGNVSLVAWPDPTQIGLRNDYHFEDVQSPTNSTWCISASPIAPGDGGDSYFAASDDGFIRYGTSKPGSRAEAIAMTSL